MDFYLQIKTMKLTRCFLFFMFGYLLISLGACIEIKGNTLDSSSDSSSLVAGLSLFPSDFRVNAMGVPVLPKP